MFPELKIREPEEETEASAILTPESGIDYLLEGLWTEQKSHTWERLQSGISRMRLIMRGAAPACGIFLPLQRRADTEKRLRAPYTARNWRTVSQGWSSLRSVRLRIT